MKQVCENCEKEFFQDEMTTFEGKNVCKICKVKIIQDKNRADIAKRSGGRRAWNILTNAQQEFIRKNYHWMTGRQLASSLDVTYNIVNYYIKKNRIKKEIAAATI